MYRRIYNKYFGQVNYHLSPEFFILKEKVTRFFILEALVKKLISNVGNEKISGIGCGAAGVLDLENSVVLNTLNLRLWQ